jgi:hypothetical protein
MIKNHEENKVIFFREEGSADEVTVGDFQGLLPGEWLGDSIVNCYLRMTQEFSMRRNSKVKLLNSHFFSKIENQVTHDLIVSCFFFFDPFFLKTFDIGFFKCIKMVQKVKVF